MCDECSRPLAEVGNEALDERRLWRMARRYEAALPGAAASERDWAIFTGKATGAIAFAALDRLSRSRGRAVAVLLAAPAGFRCEAAG